RQRDTERPDDLHVDDKLNAPGLLDRQVGGLLALQNAARVAAGKVELIHNVSAIADQTACEGKAARGMNRGYFGTHRQRGEPFGAADEVLIGVDHQCAGTPLHCGCKRGLQIAVAAGLQYMKLQPKRAGRRLRSFARSGPPASPGFISTAMAVAEGSNSRMISSRFGPSSSIGDVTPVTLPLGRSMLATRPSAT